MKKVAVLCLLAASVLGGCIASDIRPRSAYNQHLKNIALEVDRVDRGAIHVKIENNTDKPVVVDWEKSYINGKKIVKDMTRDLNKPIPDTELMPHSDMHVTLYQRDNIYYRDPVLYTPGGYQTKQIDYPAVVKILIDNVYNEKEVHFNGR